MRLTREGYAVPAIIDTNWKRRPRQLAITDADYGEGSILQFIHGQSKNEAKVIATMIVQG